jgi:NADPH-dependent 2,4-dienoyl-CoA reductase/sulfur reductase-like enzyme
LRSLADARKIIAAIGTARNVAIVGASFIGLEVAAALRQRGLRVHVVAPESIPMEKVLGPELGAFVRDLHERNGVVFHLERSVDAFVPGRLSLKGGEGLDVDMVVLGVGVRPRLDLATAAGLKIDRGVLVNAFLETSRPDIFAAGDTARFPDARTGAAIRIEHWVTAERQGQIAALNMLGSREPFRDVPFFWSKHYDVAIRYVGHAETYDHHEIDGSISTGDASVRYYQGGRLMAVASVGRDRESLVLEAELDAVYRRASDAQPPAQALTERNRPLRELLLLDVDAD